MKKLIMASVLALGLVAVSGQEAQAWSKFSFNAGISIQYEGGGNSFLWGLFQSAPLPCYSEPFCDFPGYYPGYADFGMPAYAAPSFAAPYYAPGAPAAPTANPFTAAPRTGNSQANYNPSYVSYPPQGASYGNYPAMQYGAGFGQAPAYWYGR